MLGWTRIQITIRFTADRIIVHKKGGIEMLSSKEVMQLEDILGMEQTTVNALNNFANTIQCSQSKQLLQQMAQKSQQHFQTLSKHLTSAQLK